MRNQFIDKQMGEGGRFHFLVFAYLGLTFVSGNFLAYAFSFLTMQPTKVICDNGIIEYTYKACHDDSYQNCRAYEGINNWVTKMDLVCTSRNHNDYKVLFLDQFLCLVS